MNNQDKVSITKKTCPQCGIVKNVSDFSRNKNSKDGLSFYCVECNKARYRLKHPPNEKEEYPLGYKRCTSCKTIKKTDKFGPNKKASDGKKSECRECANLSVKKWRDSQRIKFERGEINIPSEKRCPDCLQIKNMDSFYLSGTSSDGLSGICSDCSAKRARIYKSKNPHILRKWNYINKDVNCYHANKYRGKKEKATPKWLSAAQNEIIFDIYKESAWLNGLTGYSFAVDHIVPINGNMRVFDEDLNKFCNVKVCGLNVPWNLEPILSSHNSSKRNKLPKESEYLASSEKCIDRLNSLYDDC